MSRFTVAVQAQNTLYLLQTGRSQIPQPASKGVHELKGFVGITDGAYIAEVFVAIKYQSQGLGRALPNHCKQRYAQLMLDVFVANTRAVQFYQNNGFAVVETKLNQDFEQQERRMCWQA